MGGGVTPPPFWSSERCIAVSTDKQIIGARLRAAREASPYWSRGTLARLLRSVADPAELLFLAHVADLVDMIKQWEAGKHTPGRRYRPLYSRVTGIPEAELFGPDAHRARPQHIVAALADQDHRQGVLEALDVIGDGNPGLVADGLGELIEHYAQTIAALPPAETYKELVTVRRYAAECRDRFTPTPRRTDLTLACGWLSSLLATASYDMGQHAAARLWCSDAERVSEEAGHPELAGWAILTRSMIAHYQRLPRQAAILAARGQQIAAVGTVAHAKLAAQEMRAAAAIDADTMESARQHAATAIAALPSDAPTSGVYSIPLAEDPPYTATSLLLVGNYKEAIATTGRVIETVYQGEARQRGGNPSGYARSLLILGLAHAGAGDLDAAVDAGQAALAGNRPAWPTVALAGQLDHVLADVFAGASQVAAYHARYIEAKGLLRQAAPTREDRE